jgi:membrane protease YdiL (CAAX protease family)
MTEPNGDEALPVVRQWPPNEVLDPATAIAVSCSGCAAPWRVHSDLAGFRLRCSCGAWIEVPARLPPALTEPAALPAVIDDAPTGLPAPFTSDAQGRIELPVKRGQVTDQEMPVHVPMAPGTVLHGNVATQQRWTNAAFLELALLMMAFLGPWLVIDLVLEGEARTLAMPFASLITGTAVVLIAAALSPYAFTGLRKAAPRYWVEAVGFAVAAFLLAMGWMGIVDAKDESGTMLRGLRDLLGEGWLMFVLAFCPAVFEELAFRGAVQGRFYALLGRTQGLIATGAAFGLCHGVTASLPFHVGIGIYLCWLRERSASLLPGMLAHALYNGLIGHFA